MLRESLESTLAAGETFTTEFKGESKGRLNDRDLVEAVVCLANGAGGHVLIGVEDDGTVTGSRPRHANGRTDPYRLQALVANRTVPPVSVEVSLHQHSGGEIIVVEVPDVPRVVGTTDGVYRRRATQANGEPQCIAFPAHEMLAREIDRGAADYATLPAPGASWADLDPLEFERLRSLVRRAGAAADGALAQLSDDDLGRAVGVVADGRDGPSPLTGAILLFGRQEAVERFVPTHEVAFQVLRDDRVEVNDIARWPLLRAAEELYARLAARNSEEELDAGLVRVSLPTLPDVVIREAVANALVHRDYTRLGPVQVQLADDAFTVSSPGGLPPGVRLDNILRVQQPRSPRLAEAFKRAGLVERTGRGVNRMFSSLLRLGRDAPDYGTSTEESVRAVVSLQRGDIALVRYIVDRERLAGAPLPLGYLQILSTLRRDGRQSARDIASLLQQTDAQARDVLARMVEQGMVESRGTGPGRTHHLAAAVYRSLDAPAAYPRIRGFDRLQQEQMVLSYVDAHERITRAQAADLCSLTPRQAGELLRTLAADGRLVLHGSRRWAYYSRS